MSFSDRASALSFSSRTTCRTHAVVFGQQDKGLGNEFVCFGVAAPSFAQDLNDVVVVGFEQDEQVSFNVAGEAFERGEHFEVGGAGGFVARGFLDFFCCPFLAEHQPLGDVEPARSKFCEPRGVGAQNEVGQRC